MSLINIQSDIIGLYADIANLTKRIEVKMYAEIIRRMTTCYVNDTRRSRSFGRRLGEHILNDG